DLIGLALVPGAALIRIGHKVRGRLWLTIAAFVVFLIYAGAVNPFEFQDYASRGGLPPSRPRGAGVAVYLMLVVVWLLSVADTWRSRGREPPLTASLLPREGLLYLAPALAPGLGTPGHVPSPVLRTLWSPR